MQTIRRMTANISSVIRMEHLQVEMLFHKFHASVSSRITKKAKVVAKNKHTFRRTSQESSSQNVSTLRNDEDFQCPICLLEMVEGESLTLCDGCCNTLHQHCMAICKFEIYT